jgi:arylsulfatase A-like enzyme
MRSTNIIVICSDTFRRDHLGSLGRQQVVTPNLDRLAAESANFEDYWLCSFPTLVNRIEVFTGRYTFPLMGWGPLPFHYPVVSEVLQRHGFTTALITDNKHLMNETYGFGRGFDFVSHVRGQADDDVQPGSAPMTELPCPVAKLDHRVDRLERYRRNLHWHRQHGTSTTERTFGNAIRWLDEPRGKFFLWIDSFDPHEPWDAEPRYGEPYPWNAAGDEVVWPRYGSAGAYSEADLANMQSLYKAEITRTDHCIGLLLDHLRDRKLLDTTTVIFCSDHGFYFGEHGRIGKLFLEPTAIYEELGHLPLLLRHPAGLAAGRAIPGLCQPPDLCATIMDLAGVAAVDWAQGRSLVPRLEGEHGARRLAVAGCHPLKQHHSCLTVLTDEWCFIYSPYDGLAGSELYDRAGDPGQERNVLPAHRAVAERHFELLRAWLDELRVPRARQRQLLYNAPFSWGDEVRHRLWMWRNRRWYQKHHGAARRTRDRGTRQLPASV